MIPNQKLLCSAALLCGTLFVSLPTTAPAPAMPGPGGVVLAVRAFLQALDEGDAKMLDLLVGENDARDGCVVVPDETTRIGFKEVQEKDANDVYRFFDVSQGGKPLRAKDKATFLELLGKHVTCSKVKARAVETRFQTLRADCPSESCSYAVVEFERTYTMGGKKQEPVPMQATALVRYVERKDARVPHFEIFHWHASLAGAPLGRRGQGK